MREFIVKASSLLVLLIFFVSQTHAGDIRWEGNYRAEGLRMINPTLADGGNNKAYMLHHLTLKPQITAFDGLTIHSRFDIFNNSRYPNDQLGQVFGAGVNQSPGTQSSPTSNTPGEGTNASNSNTISRQQRADFIAVNELYANWAHEFGLLTVGRVPLHFGLGIMFNAGHGPFDHWLENRDMVAYTLQLGNFSVTPALAKTYEGLLDQEDDINDYILQVKYENPETELSVGAIYQARRSTSNSNSNDTPAPIAGPSATQTGNYEVDTYNVYVSQWVDNIKVSFELGFQSGELGLSANGQPVTQDAFGGVLNLSWRPKESRWGAVLDIGYASGDDPSNENVYGGYVFNRNFDVAFLLFNHPMGSADFFRTAYLRNISGSGMATSFSASESFDTEAISNTIFFSGAVHYAWADRKYDLETRLTYAMLDKDPLQTNVDSTLGMELDFSLKYEPFKGFQWINRTGIFLPGAAFRGGTNDFSTNMAIGIETKAAVTF
jgi:hypothetical protein